MRMKLREDELLITKVRTKRFENTRREEIFSERRALSLEEAFELRTLRLIVCMLLL